MGLLDRLQINEPKEDSFDDELHELKIQKNRVLSEIGKKFVEQNRGRSMYGTDYEELFAELSEIEKEMNADLDTDRKFDKATGGRQGFSDVYDEVGPDNAFNYRKVIVTGVILLAVIILAIGLASLRKMGRRAGTSAPSTQIVEGTPVVEQQTEPVVEEENASPEDILAEFGIFRSNIADYASGQIIDHTKYRKYTSDIGRFSFSYPSDLYNEVNVVKDTEGGTYGKIIKQISMAASDGSTAEFTVFENWITSKNNTLETMKGYILMTEKAAMFAPVVKVNEISQDETFGTVIMTAYADGGANADCVYDLCRVDKDNVYQMRLTYPRPKDEEEDKHKAYYLNAMYRLCGFSGSSVNTPDSYDAFIAREYTAFKLNDSQKAIFWNILDNMVTCRPLYDAYEKEYVVPVGSRNELAQTLSADSMILQMYLQAGLGKDADNIQSERFACLVDYGANGKKVFYKDEVGKESFEEYYAQASGEKDLMTGSLDYARTFYRDLFGMELDVDSVLQDNKGVEPGDITLLLYNREYDELVYCSGYLGKNRVDGPDDWDYNEEMQCFDYHMGPVYELTSTDRNWEQKRDEQDPGNGIYVAHIRPYTNNSVGFKLLGIERVE